VLWNVSVLYNEAFPDRSVAWLTNVHNIFLIDCYFIGNKGTAQHSLFKVAHFTLKETLNLLTIVLSRKEHWLLLKTATRCLITILALFFKTAIPHAWGVLFM